MGAWLVHPQRVARAIRAESPPVIDGAVDDPIWRGAPVQSGFTQEDPEHGEPATEETAFQVAYDDEAVYVAAICYDSRPDNSTILGAVKVSGKTAKRTAFGILNAVTGAEHARIDQWATDPTTGLVDTVRRDYKVEPLMNCLVGRVRQDMLTNSTVGPR